jgi:alkylated DNA nucleotide flippase Atl1
MTIWDNAPKNSQAVFEHLRLLAKRMRVESYGEIAEAIGMKEERHIAPISLRSPLGFIRDEICRARGLPWLNALAVNGDKWLPGDSFLPPGVAFDKDEQVLWRGMVLAVFSYPWESIRVG